MLKHHFRTRIHDLAMIVVLVTGVIAVKVYSDVNAIRMKVTKVKAFSDANSLIRSPELRRDVHENRVMGQDGYEVVDHRHGW